LTPWEFGGHNKQSDGRKKLTLAVTCKAMVESLTGDSERKKQLKKQWSTGLQATKARKEGN